MSIADLWKDRPIPNEVREIKTETWSFFSRNVVDEHPIFMERFVESISAGDAWIIKLAFPESFMRAMKERTIEWCKGRESTFHKILDGVPDFHRVIDEEVGKNYSIRACKHSAYFFRWNDDPLGIWPDITKRWSVIKKAIGLRADEYESNKPSDGPTDRIQVVRYPPTHGYLEPHRDAYQNQRCFISGYMSKRGEDYQGGGFYFAKNGEALYAEDMIDVGDICIAHANILHGVAPVDVGRPVDWNADDGRWFLGLYSNESDYNKVRSTSAPVKVEIPGVLP